MRIIITGGGEVGYHLAKLLTQEGHDITMLDINQKRLDYATDHLDVATMRGDSTSPLILKEAGTWESDLLIAVTSDEAINITTAILAKHLGAKHVVARISNTDFLQEKALLKSLKIDEVIIPESLAAKEIENLLHDSVFTSTFSFDNGALLLTGLAIHSSSPIHGKTLEEIGKMRTQTHTFTSVAVVRDNETIIPYGDTKMQEGDQVYFITQPQGVDELVQMAGKRRREIKNVIILGGGKVGINTAHRLHKRYRVKIIEQNRQKAFELAERFPDAMIINGDGRDVDLLVEEGIEDVGAFIAVTNNTEANIISSLLAKKKGVVRTIAMVESKEYMQLSHSIGIDNLINKKLISANFIFRYVRKGDVLSLTSIYEGDAEILEFEIKQGSPLLGVAIKDLNFPNLSIVGGVIRKGVGHAVNGNTIFMPFDRVVVLCLPDVIGAVEKLFK